MLSSLLLSNVRIFVVGSKSLLALIVPASRSSSFLHTNVMALSYRYLWCQGAVWEMRDHRGRPGIGNFLLSIRGVAENFDTFHPLAT